MYQRIERFVARLAQTSVDGLAFNPYAASTADPLLTSANAIRRQNLCLYLQAMAAARPWLLLVGEAPGYRGCRLTGVPFTSEAIILDQAIWPFGPEAGFRKTGEHIDVVREASATMIWSALNGWRPPALLWNAYPFHPHQHESPASNRKPNGRELLLGAALLAHVLELFQPDVVAAVGRSAARTLDHAGLHGYRQLRHPSHGGKAAFVAGLSRIQPPAGGR